MSKHYLQVLDRLYSFSDDLVLIRPLSVGAEHLENEESHQRPSQSSASPAASEDPSASHFNNIFAKLL
jgi:hypothetical protein